MKNELLDFCRYYKKNNTSTNADVNMFVICESAWCNFMENKTDSLNDLLLEYSSNGLSDFNQYDGIPVTLKAVLYNRFRQYYEHSTVDDFKNFYLEKYLN
jgi:hypothetical protein